MVDILQRRRRELLGIRLQCIAEVFTGTAIIISGEIKFSNRPPGLLRELKVHVGGGIKLKRLLIIPFCLYIIAECIIAACQVLGDTCLLDFGNRRYLPRQVKDERERLPGSVSSDQIPGNITGTSKNRKVRTLRLAPFLQCFVLPFYALFIVSYFQIYPAEICVQISRRTGITQLVHAPDRQHCISEALVKVSLDPADI